MKALENSKHSWAGREDIEKLQEMGDRKRFEIKDGKIRALYGVVKAENPTALLWG